LEHIHFLGRITSVAGSPEPSTILKAVPYSMPFVLSFQRDARQSVIVHSLGEYFKSSDTSPEDNKVDFV
jgi:hypothetical protein